MPPKSKEIQTAIKDEAHWKLLINKTNNHLVGIIIISGRFILELVWEM